MRRERIAGRGLAAAIAFSIFLAVLLAGWKVAARPMWRAHATALLEPAPGLNLSLRSWAYDLLTRDVVRSTYEGVVGDPRFQREAADVLGLTRPDREAIQVEVTSGTRDATVTVTVRSPQREVAERMAHTTLESARTYLTPLGGLFVLRLAPSAAVPSQRHPEVSAAAVGYVAAAATGLALLAYAVTRLAVSRIRGDVLSVSTHRDQGPNIPPSSYPTPYQI